MRGVGNLIVGGIFVVGGLTGKLALIGTNSGGALVAVGAVLVGFGIYQLAKK